MYSILPRTIPLNNLRIRKQYMNKITRTAIFVNRHIHLSCKNHSLQKMTSHKVRNIHDSIFPLQGRHACITIQSSTLPHAHIYPTFKITSMPTPNAKLAPTLPGPPDSLQFQSKNKKNKNSTKVRKSNLYIQKQMDIYTQMFPAHYNELKSFHETVVTQTKLLFHQICII